MQKFNLLIIGDANHQYIINFTKWLKSSLPNLVLSIISTNPDTNIQAQKSLPYDNLYIALSKGDFISRIKGLRTFYRAWNIYRIIKNNCLGSNAILVHYAYPWFAIICKKLKKRTQNFTVALWGSDYYRAKSKKKLNKIFNHADHIIIGTPQMVEDFKTEFNRYIQKVSLCYFGNEPIEHLKKFKENSITRKESCSIFKLTEDKLNVTLGHNGHESHQHILVLNELARLSPLAAEKIRIIIPMTYGLKQEYFEKVKLVCESMSIEYKIFTDFMTDEAVAHLRNLTDIKINLQTTDALSGSMREVLYCGGVVISGSWLPYQFLRELGIYFEEVNAIQEIGEKLNEIIVNYSSYKIKSENNPSKIYNISSWSEVITKWKEVIELQK